MGSSREFGVKKYIAFGLYQKNELGGHQEAMEPGEAKSVYLASDVDARIKELQAALKLTHDTLIEAAKIAGMSSPPSLPDNWLSP